MELVILTPAMNSLPRLESCIASVRAQVDPVRGVAVLHRVHDANSADGTREFLDGVDGDEPGYRLEVHIRADRGMYDALNKAFAATGGDIVGHLNTDEQYLPGTLAFVGRFFEEHPDVDVLFGAAVVVDGAGGYICSRMPIRPARLHTRISHLCTFTASMFYRRGAIESLGTYFDTSFTAAGDADLVLRMLDAGLKMATTRRYLSTFVDSGDNLALSPLAGEEQRRLASGAPAWARRVPVLVETHHRVRKLLSGAYTLAPFQYVFITPGGRHETHRVDKPRGRWVNRQ